MTQEQFGRMFRLRSRGKLIAATVLLQALVIGLGWLGIMHGTRSGLQTRDHERQLEESGRLVQRLSDELSRECALPIRRGEASWAAAQRFVTNVALPPGATAMLLDLQGKVLCHPALEKNPSFARVDYSEQVVQLHPDGQAVELGQLRPGAAMTGVADFPSGRAVVSVLYNPGVQAKVVLVQTESATAPAVAQLTREVMRWSGAGGVMIVLLTLAGSSILVRRYDTVLARANERLELELERRVRRGLAIRNALVFGLAKLADYRDTDTGKHLERICRYCELLSEELREEFAEITPDWIERLKLASSMHDIGKVGIADSILLKPGRLTEEERRVMEQHTIIGADTLQAIRGRVGEDDLLAMSILVALSHHEKFDGTGYPHRLAGDAIPLAARIVALADMYDALTSRRVYKAAMTHEEARRIIREARGGHLDPRIVDAFERVHGRFDHTRMELHADDMDPPALLHAVEQARAAAGKAAA